MPKYKFDGFNKDGKKTSGEIMASNMTEVRRILRRRGIRVRNIKAPSILEFDLGEWMVNAGLAAPFTTKDLLNFTKQLATMVNAGIPILQSLEVLYKNQKNPALKVAVRNIASEVGEGKTIYEALTKQKGFSRLYCNLVKAGEAGGVLDTVLDKLVVQMEKSDALKSKVKGALTYPTIIAVVGFIVIYVLLVYAVPVFQGMLESGGQETPALTQYVIDASDFCRKHAVLILFGAIGSALSIKYYAGTREGKKQIDKVAMKLPLFGGIIIKGNLASFSRTLATMLSSGVSLIDSLEIGMDTIDNTVIQKDIKNLREQVMKGKSLTDVLVRIEYFPEMVGQMIKVGESAGNLDHMLGKISDVFDTEIDELTGRLTELAGPVIIVIIGGIIGTVMIAMYLPVFMSAGNM